VTHMSRDKLRVKENLTGLRRHQPSKAKMTRNNNESIMNKLREDNLQTQTVGDSGDAGKDVEAAQAQI